MKRIDKMPKATEGSLIKKLADEIVDAAASAAAAKLAAKAKPKTEAKAPRVKIEFVEVTSGGKSKIQSTSRRGAVYAMIASQPKKRASVTALREKMGKDVPGHVQKLVAAGHLKLITEKEFNG